MQGLKIFIIIIKHVLTNYLIVIVYQIKFTYKKSIFSSQA